MYNQVSEVAHKHDHRYDVADKSGTDSDDIKEKKLQADREMLDALEQIKPNSFSERFQRWIAKVIIGLKVKMGFGIAEELHKPIIRKFQRRAVFVTGLDHTWGADLIVMPNSDNNYKNILTVIDIFSKHAWAIPLKTKTNKELIKAFDIIFTTSNRKPQKLWTDQGTEFYGSEFQIYLMNKGIELYSTFSEFKSCIIERFNRTLKNKMWYKFTQDGMQIKTGLIYYQH